MPASVLLAVLLPVVLLGVARVGATTFPATVEVDLIFPRNDTYGPSVLFPIVFAIQNIALAPSLDPSIDFETSASQRRQCFDLWPENRPTVGQFLQ